MNLRIPHMRSTRTIQQPFMSGASRRPWLVCVLAFLLYPFALQAQDIHFSQVDADPLLLNPAYAGFYQGAGRFGMVYRNQWASVSIPYQTLAVTGEVAMWRGNVLHNGVSLGVSFFGDNAGSLHYGTTSAHLSLAYYQAINRVANSVLSFGIEGGYAQSGFDPSQALVRDPGESFDAPQINYPLLALGVAWYYQPTGDFHLKVGFSARNLNRPNISYMGLDEVYLHRRYSLFARAEYRHWQHISLMPVLMLQTQGQHREIVYGADLKWYIEEGGAHESSIRAGVAMRQADAVIANLMLEYDALLFTFCYDANISGLAAASHTIGAFEVGLVYRLPQSAKKTKALKCPMY